jgi:hypothetical protein
VVQDWYPKIVQLLPSEGYEAPTNVTIRYREDMRGTPASASGTRINCNIDWFKKNLKGEAVGSVVHEMVHVVQQYGRARRDNPDATRTPGWLVEGIPDYIRWFLYEPQTKGAEITPRNISRAKYDASYRITGNFLNWVTLKYDRDIARKLNAAARAGKYKEELWKDYTGKRSRNSAMNGKRPRRTHRSADAQHTLTDDEKKAGWQLLFNGKDFDGWHNFKTNTIRAGWQIKDAFSSVRTRTMPVICALPANSIGLNFSSITTSLPQATAALCITSATKAGPPGRAVPKSNSRTTRKHATRSAAAGFTGFTSPLTIQKRQAVRCYQTGPANGTASAWSSRRKSASTTSMA